MGHRGDAAICDAAEGGWGWGELRARNLLFVAKIPTPKYDPKMEGILSTATILSTARSVSTPACSAIHGSIGSSPF